MPAFVSVPAEAIRAALPNVPRRRVVFSDAQTEECWAFEAGAGSFDVVVSTSITEGRATARRAGIDALRVGLYRRPKDVLWNPSRVRSEDCVRSEKPIRRCGSVEGVVERLKERVAASMALADKVSGRLEVPCACGLERRLRANDATGALFLACTGYKAGAGCRRTESL